MDFQHLSMTRCPLPTQIHYGFGTASSSRLEVDSLQPRLELHITLRDLHHCFDSISFRRKENPVINCLTARRMSLQIHGDCPPSLELWLLLMPAISGYQTQILIKRRVPFKFPWSPALALLIKGKVTGSEVKK